MLAVLPPHARSQGSGPALLEQLDSHYYFPQREGLKRLAFSIHWAQLDPFSEKDDKKLLNNPTVRFHWTEGMQAPEYEIEDSDSTESPLRELEIIQFMRQFSEVFLPVPLGRKLTDYSLKEQQKGDRFLKARYVTDTPTLSCNTIS